MNCPKCKSNQIEILDSRKNGNRVRRRRVCIVCGERFTTYEIMEKEFRSLQEKVDFLHTLLNMARKAEEEAPIDLTGFLKQQG